MNILFLTKVNVFYTIFMVNYFKKKFINVSQKNTKTFRKRKKKGA